jgi:hypothetical protein
MRSVYNKDKLAVKLLLGLKLLDGEAELKDSGGAAAMLTACSCNDSSSSTTTAAASAKAKPYTWLEASKTSRVHLFSIDVRLLRCAIQTTAH